jgi:hypothetical protein
MKAHSLPKQMSTVNFKCYVKEYVVFLYFCKHYAKIESVSKCITILCILKKLGTSWFSKNLNKVQWFIIHPYNRMLLKKGVLISQSPCSVIPRGPLSITSTTWLVREPLFCSLSMIHLFLKVGEVIKLLYKRLIFISSLFPLVWNYSTSQLGHNFQPLLCSFPWALLGNQNAS